MIVAGKGRAGSFLELLGDGSGFEVNLSYMVQEQPKGIAHALGLCEKFVDDENIAVILGDNIFEDKFNFSEFKEGAKVYLKRVPGIQAQRFGVARLDENKEDKDGYNKNKIIEIVEKPINPPSNLVVTGLYLYDSDVFSVIDCLRPSERGELEISDVNDWYVKQRRMDYDIIENFWSDMGTFDSLYRASSFIRSQTKNN
jgi:glucose-1-phosphate thymidylyltransferase